ncbi:MAG: methyltransferase domain-containing protein [Fusobacteriaceae bacterium]
MKNYWDMTYDDNSITELGWYEKMPSTSISLIEKYLPDKTALIMDAGCGETTLIQELLNRDYSNIIGIDMSSTAIDYLNKNIKLKNNDFTNLSLKCEDLTNNIIFSKKGNLWHDRAVFHFLQEKSNQESYKKNLINFLEPNGIFIISCFSTDNVAEKCNNLPVKKYDSEELKSFFSDSFDFLESFIYDYIMPWGDTRKYLYCVFRKK